MITKEEILSQIILLYKKYFPNVKLDFDKLSLESNLALIQSYLDENLLLYATVLANESLLTTAILPDTIEQFAYMFGYAPKMAVPASGNVDFLIPRYDASGTLIPEISFTIDFNYTLSYNNITYIPMYKIKFQSLLENGTVTCTATDIFGNQQLLPYYFENVIIDGKSYEVIRISIPFMQASINLATFSVSQTDVSDYKLPSYDISIDSIGLDSGLYVSNFVVRVNNFFAKQYSYLFQMDSDNYGYVLYRTQDAYRFVFGNGIVGKALKPGDVIAIQSFVTMGSSGNVPANSLTPDNNIVNEANNTSLLYFIRHTDFDNGEDPEDPLEVKKKTLEFISSNRRLVSYSDFLAVKDILGEKFQFDYFKIIMSRGDLQASEIDFFISKYDSTNEIFIPINTINNLFTKQVVLKQYGKIYEKTDGTFVYEVDETPPDDEIVKVWILPYEIEINLADGVPNVYYNNIVYTLTTDTVRETPYSLSPDIFIKLTNAKLYYSKADKLFHLQFICYANLNDSISQSQLGDLFSLSLSLKSQTDVITEKDLSLSNINYDSDKKELIMDYIVYKHVTYESYSGGFSILFRDNINNPFEDLAGYNIYPFRFKVDLSDYIGVKLINADAFQNLLSLYGITTYDSQVTYAGLEVNSCKLFGISVIEEDYFDAHIDEVSTLINGIIQTAEEIKKVSIFTTKPEFLFGRAFGKIENVKFSYLDNYVPNTVVQPGEVEIPLKLKAYIFISSYKPLGQAKAEIEDFIKKQFFNNYTGFEKSFRLSALETDIMNQFDYINSISLFLIDVNGNEIKKDIIYNYDTINYSTIPKSELFTYIPEFISLGDVELDVRYG